MLEIQNITDTGKYANYNETARRGENQKTGFSEVMYGENEILENSPPATDSHDRNGDEMSLGIDSEVLTYTFSGEMSLFRKFTGRIIDIEV